MAASSSTFKILHTQSVTKSEDLNELANLLMQRWKQAEDLRYSWEFLNFIVNFLFLISEKRKDELEQLTAKIHDPEHDLHKEELASEELAIQDARGDTLLTWAVWYNDLALTKALLKIKNFNINVQTKGGDTALTYAVRRPGYTECALALLESGRCDVNLVDRDLNSALTLSSFNASLDVIKKIISLGPDLNKRNKAGESPLHLAILANRLDVVSALIEEKDCDLNTPDYNKRPPILQALSRSNYAIAERLIKENRCDLNQTNWGGFTPLTYVLSRLRERPMAIDIARLLIDSPRCNFNLYNYAEKTPLMMAVEINRPDLLRAMLTAKRNDIEKCDINLKTKCGTVLDFAMEISQREWRSCRDLSNIAVLLEFGAKISKPRNFLLFLNKPDPKSKAIEICYAHLYAQHGPIPRNQGVEFFTQPSPLPLTSSPPQMVYTKKI